MATDIFLEFVGNVLGVSGETKVVGESQDKAHPNTVPVNAFTFGVENKQTISSAAAGAGLGKASLNALTIGKAIDLSTPVLFATSAVGGHFPQVNLYVRKSGTAGSAGDYLIYRFRLVFVTKMTWSDSSGDDAPQEEVEFTYGAVQVQYSPQTPTGQLGTAKQQAWSQVTNKPDFIVPGIPN